MKMDRPCYSFPRCTPELARTQLKRAGEHILLAMAMVERSHLEDETDDKWQELIWLQGELDKVLERLLKICPEMIEHIQTVERNLEPPEGDDRIKDDLERN
jgi:hypothetical protein